MPAEILSSTHFDLICSHPEVLVDNKKVSKLLKTPAFNRKVKAIVVDEANFVVEWHVSRLRISSLTLFLKCCIALLRATGGFLFHSFSFRFSNFAFYPHLFNKRN